MHTLEQVKERLNDSLSRINAKLIDAQTLMQDYRQLEIENNELKAKILLLKKEITGLKYKVRELGIEQEQKSIGKQINEEKINSINEQQPDFNLEFNHMEETQVSLSELKGLLENKKWG